MTPDEHVTSRELLSAFQELAREMRANDKVNISLNAQVSTLITVTGDLKQVVQELSHQAADAERKAYDLEARLAAVEKNDASPLLTPDEQNEVRRILGIVRARGLVDVFTPGEVTALRQLLDVQVERADAARSIRERVKSLEAWRVDLDQRMREREVRLAAIDERFTEMAKRQEQLHEQAAQVARRLYDREMLHHLDEDQLTRTRAVLDAVFGKDGRLAALVEVADTWITDRASSVTVRTMFRANVLSAAVTAICVTVPIALIIFKLTHG